MTAAELVELKAPRQCSWCGKSNQAFDKTLYVQRRQYKCQTCASFIFRVPLGAEVFPGVPGWLRSRLNKKFPAEVRSYVRGRGANRTRLSSNGEAWGFLVNSSYRGLVDHEGHDAHQNFISEPYADKEQIEPQVAELAGRLNVKYTISLPSWHMPWAGDCLRICFFRPERP
jgi:hypothetical protein